LKANNLLIISSALLLLLCWWNRNHLPADMRLVPELASEPRQTRASKTGFEASFKGVDYAITPQYDYELYGLVVSFRHHDGNSRMHRQSNDHLNMLDVCVLWGDTAASPLLNEITFWNGIFTCNVQTRDQAAWDAFDIYELSNNHLISDDPRLREKLRDIRIGDQIRVRGYLASYASANGGTRGTSTTRLDTGDGACETIYVQEFDIVRKASNFWRSGMYVSLLMLLAGLLIHFIRPYRPHKN
tara:strand:+ start:1083 stop:1811 length:729 start_codon:yes stop_codon:yes gene_type:complete